MCAMSENQCLIVFYQCIWMIVRINMWTHCIDNVEDSYLFHSSLGDNETEYEGHTMKPNRRNHLQFVLL